MRLRTRPCLAFAVLTLVVFPTAASASLIEWGFEGVVRIRRVDGPTASDRAAVAIAADSLGAVVGAPVRGSLTFDTTAQDIHPEDPALGTYVDAVVDSQISIGDRSLVHGVGPSNSIIAIGMSPTHFLSANDNVIDPTGTLSLALFGLNPESRDANTLPTDALPLDPPTLASLVPFGLDYDTSGGYGSEIFFAASVAGGSLILQSEITRIERVPEPAIAILVGVAALALLGVSSLRRSPRLERLPAHVRRFELGGERSQARVYSGLLVRRGLVERRLTHALQELGLLGLE
jgi:hypothetical protein